MKYKFTDFEGIITNETDLFFIYKSKLDRAFLNAQLKAEGYRLFY